MSSRISFKLVLIVAISLLGMIVLAPIALYTMRTQMVADRQAKTQQMVDVGYGILLHYQKLESEGKLTREQAQAVRGEVENSVPRQPCCGSIDSIPACR